MWNLSSTSENIKTLESPIFCGTTGFRIGFTFNAPPNQFLSGKDIHQYSAIASEAENFI